MANIHSQPEQHFINAILFKNDPAGAWVDVQVRDSKTRQYGLSIMADSPDCPVGPERFRLNPVKVFKNTTTSIPDLIEYGIEMVETVHQGPHKGFKMDIIFDNWARRSRVVKYILNCEVVKL